MANPTELDLFNRSLGGDRRARTELYKKYVFGSSRVRRMGAGYSSLNDFLHDCLNNLLRTGHSWDTEETLTRWVESVATWTALANNRQKEMHARGAHGEIRMCSETEGEDVIRGEVLAAYAPPLLGADDSPVARILMLQTDTERPVFQKRGLENATWEETAAAAGKPLNAVGPIFARITARLVRLFGAPPPDDDDLVPVVSRVFKNPLKPEGRAISLQLDNTFYDLTPEMQAVGLKTAYEARTVVLWEAARQATPPGDDLRQHLSKCHYCSALLRSMLLMQRALLAPPGAPFLLCPGAFTLANAPDMVHEDFDQHLAQCSLCRTERTDVLEGRAPRQGERVQTPAQAAGPRKRTAWTLAAVLLLGIASFAAYRHFAPHPGPAPLPLTSDKPHSTVAPDSRYRDLVQQIPIDDRRILDSVQPDNRASIKYALDQYSLGQSGEALSISEQVATKSKDPGAEMLYAMSLLRTGLLTDAYREMLTSEAMSPRDPLRCWVLLQFALLIGDRAVIEQETRHLAKNAEYGEKADKILAIVRARG